MYCYSGSKEPFDVVLSRISTNGLWTTKCYDTAQLYGEVRTLYVSPSNPLDLRHLGWQCTLEEIKEALHNVNVFLPDQYYEAFRHFANEEEQDVWFVYAIIDGFQWMTDREIAIRTIREAGFDSLLIHDTHYHGLQSDSLVLFDEAQIKTKKEKSLLN